MATDVPEAATLPPRPSDADSLSRLLSWASGLPPEGRPKRQPGDPEPMAVDAWPFGYWWSWHKVEPPRQPWPPGPVDQDDMDDYMRRLAAHLLYVLASADLVERVVGGDDSPEDVPYALELYCGPHPESWRYLLERTPGYGGYAPDSPDLWRWASARHDTGARRQARNQGRTFPNALRTAQAVWDALALVLPRAVEPEPRPALPAPTPRRNSWR